MSKANSIVHFSLNGPGNKNHLAAVIIIRPSLEIAVNGFQVKAGLAQQQLHFIAKNITQMEMFDTPLQPAVGKNRVDMALDLDALIMM